MKITRIILFSLLYWTSLVFAVGEPLKVGIVTYNPPFVQQGANHRIYGFDIDMMNAICKRINRTCQFQVMRFGQLLDAVADKTVDIAVSDITITPERAQKVYFSLPYMLSKSMFLQKNNPETQPFSLNLFNGKKIGVSTGSIFEAQIIAMGIKNPIIKNYNTTDDLLEALSSGNVDFIVIDAPTARFWVANSDGVFKTVGEEYAYGNGLGIAINFDDKALLEEINNALLQYENSEEYKTNYNSYFSQF